MSTRLVVLASGEGHRLQVLLDAIRYKALDAQIVAAVFDVEDGAAVARARKAGVPVRSYPAGPDGGGETDAAAFDAELTRIVRSYSPDLIVLDGWLRGLGSEFLGTFSYRIVNVHAALPGQFPGAHAVARALEEFQAGRIRKTGNMVYLVTSEESEMGPVLESDEVVIYGTDSVETLRKRLQQAEQGLLVRALRRLTEGDES